jgi:hypothetical protein
MEHFMAIDMFIKIDTIKGETKDGTFPDPPPPPPSPKLTWSIGITDVGLFSPPSPKPTGTAYRQLNLATQAWIDHRVFQIASTGSFTGSQRGSLIQEVLIRFGSAAVSGSPSMADVVCDLAEQAVARSKTQGQFTGLR